MSTIVEALLAGGPPALKFDTLGVVHSGRITAVEARQQTDYDNGTPMVYADGNPMMQIIVDLDTDQRDPSIPDDDGSRRAYIKGQMLSAARSAVKQAGARSLLPGGTLTVAWIGEGVAKNARFNKPKIYQVTYVAPSGVEQVLAAPAAVAPQVQAAAPPVVAQAAPAAPRMDAVKIAQLKAMGYSDEQISKLT
jgi:hypothetical protein